MRRRFPWPTSIPPGVRPNEASHFLRPQTQAMLQRRLRERRPDLIVEIGSWLGGSTRVIADISRAHVIAIDTWLGSKEHQTGTEWDRRHDSHREILAQLFHTFAMNCSNYRDVITPVRATSLAGLHEVHSHGLQPGLVFIDGAHDKASVAADLRTAHDLFGKNAWIVLDDYGSGESWLRGLEEAVNEFARRARLPDRTQSRRLHVPLVEADNAAWEAAREEQTQFGNSRSTTASSGDTIESSTRWTRKTLRCSPPPEALQTSAGNQSIFAFVKTCYGRSS